MSLDTLTTRHRQVALLERYGGLLTDHQREVLDLHIGRDWSLAEIAAKQGVSRAAVHDLVRRAVATMEDAEARLGLLEEDARRRRAAAEVAAELTALGRRLARLESRLEEL